MIKALKNNIKRAIRTYQGASVCWKNNGLTPITKAHISQINHGCILQNKNILITGGSSGIGKAIAKKCLSEGAQVLITGRNQEKLIQAQIELNNQNLHILSWDVADSSIRENQIAKSFQIFGGKIDALINNAGLLLPQSFFSTTEDTWDKTYSVNSKASFFLTQGICNRWIEKKTGGKVLFISSTGGFLGAQYPYRMTKWDLVGLTQGIGLLLAPYGIIANGIAPGRIATSMLDKDSSENIYDTFQPLKRFGTPEEIAELAIFLLSDAANYIVGQTIICDGGYTLKS